MENEYIYKRKPFKHQLDIINKVLQHDKYAIFAEMGTGKTQSVLNACDIRQEYPVLIVCPKSVMDNWRNEIQVNCHRSAVSILTGSKKERVKRLEYPANYYIINYDALDMLQCELYAKGFKVIIADESTYIKSHKASRTKALINIGKIQGCKKYILTGTPITNTLLDAFSQFKFLSPSCLGFENFYAFRGRTCVMGGFKQKEVIGYKNTAELKENMAKWSIRILKKDCLDLPDKLYQVRTLDMPDDMKAQYKEMQKTLSLELDGETITAPIVLVKLLRLQQIISGHYIDGINPKMAEIMEILEQTHGKVIIWCCFRRSVEIISNMFKDKAIKHEILTGDTKDRQDVIDRFNNSDSRCFIGMIQAGGIGINLTSANTVIYYENTFKLQDRLQSEDRTHRIGQDKNVLYIDLEMPKTIDTKIIKALKDKKEVSDYLIDNIKEVLE